jgi:hypothetical protein
MTRGPAPLVGAAAVAAAMLLAGCANSVPPAASPLAPATNPVASATPSPTPESDASESPVAGSDAPSVVPAEPGDCELEPDSPGAVLFVVTADDAVTPIELTYSAFRPDGTPEIRTATATGPVVTVLQTNCGDPVASAPWTFTAAAQTGDGLACASFYGGKHLVSDSDFAEGDAAAGVSVDCSGHPGM